LVFSTVHTNDSAGAITRLVDMGVEPFLVASSLTAIMAQRLVRRVCMECREAYEPTDEELKEVGHSRKSLQEHYGTTQLYKAQGCAACSRTGYRGRTGIYELLPVDDDVRQLILKNVDSSSIKKTATSKGMVDLLEDGARKVATGETTLAEVLSVTQEDI
jgi:general secretion pathway protein E